MWTTHTPVGEKTYWEYHVRGKNIHNVQPNHLGRTENTSYSKDPLRCYRVYLGNRTEPGVVIRDLRFDPCRRTALGSQKWRDVKAILNPWAQSVVPANGPTIGCSVYG